jgi:DNA replication initiation complex subunit (GINS family)
MLKKRLLARSRTSGTIMTLPDERYRSIMQARRLLEELMDPKLTPRVAAGVRDRARGALRHYPSEYDMRKAAQTSPDIFQERMEDLHKFVTKGQLELEAREQQLKEKLEWLGQK